MCETGHPGINKGCHYVGLNVTQIPYDKNFKMDIKALRKKITT
jgi:glutamate/tyrosine decarboxylase-like PLP-dependent enzyme